MRPRRSPNFGTSRSRQGRATDARSRSIAESRHSARTGGVSGSATSYAGPLLLIGTANRGLFLTPRLAIRPGLSVRREPCPRLQCRLNGRRNTGVKSAQVSSLHAAEHNNTALKAVKPQNKKGLTETIIFPSAVCFTLNSSSFCAVASATVTYNSPMQVTSCAARFLEFMSTVSSNLYTAPCLAFSQIPNFSASDFVSPTIAATELEFLTA